MGKLWQKLCATQAKRFSLISTRWNELATHCQSVPIFGSDIELVRVKFCAR